MQTTIEETLMDVDTKKLKAIAEAVGAKGYSPDAILAAARGRNYTWKQLQLIIGDARKALASIGGNVTKTSKLLTDFDEVIGHELSE